MLLFTGHLSGMVNGWFPDATFYGFEMVVLCMRHHQRPSIENLRRINSGEFSAIFRRIYFNADTSDLSTGATPEANSGIDRARSKDR
ncbi:hypothetical protein [Bradyrhizobium uaiense]|uniref:Uncharacterized protein n=1 Tax=Bradyrhizobium uaiense TaxID=2594946 RepID=A0A6P1BK40_9BRAD|nr:hypothetical protein [Bradyrhizobium uaiense]NEU98775.1 hypothetical protein [Bradyrhizobium uaiense]